MVFGNKNNPSSRCADGLSCCAALRYHFSASLKSFTTPSPLACILPKANCARAFPFFANTINAPNSFGNGFSLSAPSKEKHKQIDTNVKKVFITNSNLSDFYNPIPLA